MQHTELASFYHGYIDCLNAQNWARLGRFVDPDVSYNGERIGLSGYRQMLETDFESIPDLRFNIALLVCDATHIASRLQFDCTPKASFMGLAVNGRRISFAENVFYEVRAGKIVQVWSVIDKAAVDAQLR